MDRRDFFKSAVALAASFYLPSAVATKVEGNGHFLSIDVLRNAVDKLQRNSSNPFNDDYIVFIHPSTYEDIKKILTPKERWKIAYRKARMELNGMADSLRASGEFGTYENFRFISSV